MDIYQCPRLLIDINTPEKDSDLSVKKINYQPTSFLIYIALETPGRVIIIQGP